MLDVTPYAAVCIAVAAVAACGGSTPPAAAPAASTSDDTASLSPPASASTPAAPADTAPARPPRPLDLTNSCAKAMRLYYGENPGDGAGQFATVDPGATIPVPRGPDGAVVVWVVTDKGLGLATVHVTKRMKHVAIDTSCMKIDAN
jgi:hypothetical protein